MGDADSGEKKGAAPSWQTDLKNATPTEGDAEAQPPSRTTLVEQARRFLEEDDVRNASTDKKISFLEGKGLTSEEIQSLIGVARHAEASAPPSTASSSSPQPKPAYPQSSVPPPPPPAAKATPPVITYPEFLTTPAQPSPLVTTARLRSTLYLFGGLSALLYGTSNYLVAPMVAALTASRRSLAATASSNLDELIARLEPLVSELPPSVPRGSSTPYTDDVSVSSDEDPTELFHRDVGVQTSTPPRSLSPDPTSTSAIVLGTQESQLKNLTEQISGLVEDSASEGQETSDLTTCVAVLREYLDGLAYVAPSYGYGVGGFAGLGRETKEEDEIARVKASIRGVKGVLLSTRSFPGGLRGK